MSELHITRKTDINPQEHTESQQSKPTNVNQTNFTDFLTPFKTMALDSKFPQYMSHPYDKNNWWVVMDHCYSRPWNWRPESAFLRPTKTLFIPKPTKRKSVNPLAPVQDSNDEDLIDVETAPEEPALIYDKEKAKGLMEECEKHAVLAKGEEADKDWEENISRVNWSPIQNRLFNGMVNVLNSHHLGQLAYVNSHNEAICRRTIIDKSVERVRKLFATISWDFKFAQWLHQLLIDNLSSSYLTAYLDILQTLKSKLPTLVDKFMTNTNSNKLNILNYESLFPLLKRPWDPVAQSLMQDKPKKLPGNPIILIVPSSQPINSKRLLKWINLLSNLGTVISVPLNYGNATTNNSKMTMTTFVDQMFVTTRSKIQDIRVDYPGRNIVLVGFNSGATLAMQIAQIEQVLCCICLGFSLYTAEGKRGEPDDNLLELQCPVLFIIGQCSNTSLQEDMEDLRERMRVETGLIVVGSADDYLRVNKKKKRAEGITQSVVDRCIADEIGEFISGVIMSPYPPQIRQSPTNLSNEGIMSKKMKTERKRYNSNTSSLDSEPPSPTPRITRPGQNNSSTNFGRPPGSKTKNKWTNQGILPPSSPSSSSPPPPYSLNTDTSSNDSFLNDSTNKSDLPPLKKLKTLKPVHTTNSQNTTPNTSPGKSHSTAKLQGLTAQSRNLSALLQNEIQSCATQKFPSSSNIKVLENVKINPGTAQKVFSNSGKTISVLNTAKNSASSLVLLPDGKIKSISPGSRYITSKRQLIGNKPPKPMKKLSYLPSVTLPSSLPPPTNLTTQDIMDLPIIFADDQIIDNQMQNQELNNKQINQASSSKIISTTTGNKFVLINKQNNSNFVITNKNQKLTTPKYAKVVVSSKRNTNLQLKTTQDNLPTLELKINKSVDALDLENEIMASTVFKQNVIESDHKEDDKVGEIKECEGDKPAKMAKIDDSGSDL